MEITMNQSQILKATLFLVLAAGMTACGSSKRTGDSSIELASRAPVTTITSGTSTNGKIYAYCNEATSAGSGFKFRMKVYTDNNVIRNDLLKVRITQVPSGFEDSTTYFQLYRWQANSVGSVYLDPTPVSFKILDPQTGNYVSSSRNYLRWNDVSTSASQMGYSSASDFFNRVVFIADIRDPLAQFDVLKVVQYKQADSTQVDAGDGLIPTFDADPNAYATETDGSARANVLRTLHPFAAAASGGWSAATFQTYADNLCSGMP